MLYNNLLVCCVILKMFLIGCIFANVPDTYSCSHVDTKIKTVSMSDFASCKDHDKKEEPLLR